MADNPKLQKRLRRAEEDVRAAHRTANRLVQTLGGDSDSWRSSRKAGWSIAETLIHLARTGARASEQLRLVAAQGALTRPRARSTSQGVALKLMLTTWRVPDRLELLPGTDPGGLVASPADVMDEHVGWTVSFVGLLREHAPEFLQNVRAGHPRFGDLDVFEWARFVRIYFRHHELRLGSR